VSSKGVRGLGSNGIDFLCCRLAVLTEGSFPKEKNLFTSESVLTKDLVCLLNWLPVHPVQEAEKAIQCLNGKLALSKKLVVRWAHAQVKVSCLG